MYASYGDGNDKATLTFTSSHPDYPGVVLKDIPVKGDVDPEINATFKGKDLTVTYTPELEGGKVSVALVGGTFLYGSKLQITPAPKDGFDVESVKEGDTPVTSINDEYITSRLKENTSIVITFKPKADHTKKVTLESKEGITWTKQSNLSE